MGKYSTESFSADLHLDTLESDKSFNKTTLHCKSCTECLLQPQMAEFVKVKVSPISFVISELNY